MSVQAAATQRAPLAPAALVLAGAGFAYAMMLAVLIRYGIWPDSPVDWVPIDQAKDETITSLIGLSGIGVAIPIAGVIAWLGSTAIRIYIGKAPSRLELRSLSYAVVVAAAFLVCGGFRYLVWVLD